MITKDDGKKCLYCGEYFNPWFIRKIIADGDDKTFCCTCRRFLDIDDLVEVNENENSQDDAER